ncbi:S4 domain-containing protein YaaA [Bacillus piscicola]|uniref:S4 domain-containing protein YaaA n=1 Tax=Bacillus piscicola TaxID=1632684 RepID=UPI001F090FB7|nr:S4 domain-containing protein YaaA [Bacillus piscicola]
MSRSVEIDTEYITLGQLLKETGVIDSGGMAKMFLAEHAVSVNGEPEQRRGKKLYDGSNVHIEGAGSFTIISQKK